VLYRRSQLATSGPRAPGTCFLCRWRAKPAKRGRRAGRAISGPTPRRRSARVAPISTRSVQRECRGRLESFARLALIRVPLVATLGLELGILGEKPPALEGVGATRMPIATLNN
jgi:hypothetical protein